MILTKPGRAISLIIAILFLLAVMAPPVLAAPPHENPDAARQIFSALSLFTYYADTLDFVLKKEPKEVERRLQKMPFANLPQTLRATTDKFTASGIDIAYMIANIDKDISRMRTLVSEFRFSESTQLGRNIFYYLSQSYELLEKMRTATQTSGTEFIVFSLPKTSNIVTAYLAALARIDMIKELLDLYKSLLLDLQGAGLNVEEIESKILYEKTRQEKPWELLSEEEKANFKKQFTEEEKAKLWELLSEEEKAKLWEQLKAFLMANKLMLPTEISLSLDTYSAFVGEKVGFEGKLKSEGRPLAGREVIILVNGSPLARILTSGEGVFKGEFQVPFWYITEVNIQALYYPKDKDIGFYISSVSDVIKLQVMFYMARLKVRIDGKTYPGLQKEVHGEFDYGESPLPASRKVEIYLDSVLIGQGNVDSTFTQKINVMPDISLGKHTLTISTVAIGRYSPVISDAHLVVNQAMTVLDIDIPRMVFIPGSMNIRGRLRSELGPLKGAALDIQTGDSQIRMVTGEDGYFRDTMDMGLTLNLIGSRNLTVQVTPREPWNAPLSSAKKFAIVNIANTGFIILLIVFFRKVSIPGGFRRKLIWRRRKKMKPQLAAAAVEPVPSYSIKQVDIAQAKKIKAPEGGPREIILYFYRLLLKLLQGIANKILKPHYTLREYAYENIKILGPFSTYFLELTKFVEKLLYSRYSPDEKDMLNFKRLSGEIEEGLKKGNV